MSTNKQRFFGSGTSATDFVTVVSTNQGSDATIEGDAPARAIHCMIKNRGENQATLRIQESANGTVWTTAQYLAADSSVVVAPQAQRSVSAVFGPSALFFRFQIQGIADMMIEIVEQSTRAVQSSV